MASSDKVASDKVFAGSIPEIYDRFMVPLIFEPFADDLAGRLALLQPRDVLETAAGTGALTRAILSHLGPDVRLTATDMNQPMLDRAAAGGISTDKVTLRQADAMALPFPDQSFDAVVCQFGVMFFPDKITGYKEAWRVLRPGGRLLFNVWDRIGENAFAEAVAHAVAQFFPNDPPDFMARTPHGYHDVDVMRREVLEAGFASVAVETVAKMSRALKPRDVAVAFCQGTPLRSEIVNRDASRLDEVTALVAEALALRYGNGPMEAPIQAHVVIAGR